VGKYADKKEVVAACMESPLYFAVPLKERLELMRQLQQPSFYCSLRRDFLFWIKTGRLISWGGINAPGQHGERLKQRFPGAEKPFLVPGRRYFSSKVACGGNPQLSSDLQLFRKAVSYRVAFKEQFF
jgi:hypothetical protein